MTGRPTCSTCRRYSPIDGRRGRCGDSIVLADNIPCIKYEPKV